MTSASRQADSRTRVGSTTGVVAGALAGVGIYPLISLIVGVALMVRSPVASTWAFVGTTLVAVALCAVAWAVLALARRVPLAARALGTVVLALTVLVYALIPVGIGLGDPANALRNFLQLGAYSFVAPVIGAVGIAASLKGRRRPE